MAPLPPRPDKAPQKENENENENKPDVGEHTEMEQKAGQETVQLSKSRFELEQEAGRKLVAYNIAQAAKRAKQ